MSRITITLIALALIPAAFIQGMNPDLARPLLAQPPISGPSQLVTDSAWQSYMRNDYASMAPNRSWTQRCSEALRALCCCCPQTEDEYERT